MAFRIRDSVRIILGFSSAVIGMFFLSKSSFSELQFSDDESARATAFSFLTALFIVFLFVGPDLKDFVVAESRVERVRHFVMKSLVLSFSFVIVFLLIFLIKHPRFSIHSEYTRPCVDEQRREISRGVEYNLFSFIAFAVLALIISFKRKQPSQLGFFGNLLGLIIDTSMEIKGTNGPNLRYIVGSGLCCILLIFLRCYAETFNNVHRDATEEAREVRARRRKFQILTCLELLSASFGVTFLSLSSFSKLQFEGSTDLKVACFSISALLLGTCLLKLPDWMDNVVTVCRRSTLATAAVNSLLLMIVSVMIFLNKFPRFQVHSKYRESCTEKEIMKTRHGSLFDLYSAGTFSFFALIVSSSLVASSNEHQVELGIFSFLLQLTMDVAIETLDNEEPKARYVLGAAVYCVGLIVLKTWLSTWGLDNGVGNADSDESSRGPTRSVGGSRIRGDREHDAADEDRDNVLSEQGRRPSLLGGSRIGGDREYDAADEDWENVLSEQGRRPSSVGGSGTGRDGEHDAADKDRDDVLIEIDRQSSGETEWEMVGDDGTIRADIGDSCLDRVWRDIIQSRIRSSPLSVSSDPWRTRYKILEDVVAKRRRFELNERESKRQISKSGNNLPLKIIKKD